MVDANILLSRTLRDWTFLLSWYPQGNLYDIKWTEDIITEYTYHRRKKVPFASDQQLTDVRRKLIDTVPEGLIAGFEIDPTLEYNDKGDAHLHAAAAYGDVDIILSQNIKDVRFADDLPYEVYTADEFFILVDDSAPAIVSEVLEFQLRHWIKGKSARPNDDHPTLPKRLESANAPQFADRVLRHMRRSDLSFAV